MLLESQILQTMEQQKAIQDKASDGLIRDLKPALGSLSSHALILSGIRRCGKSTLLLQISKQMENSKWVYLNFESPALYGFTLSDFTKLDNILNRIGVDTLFFDEIQMVDKWELYVRQKLDEKKKVIVTGSNASMLNTELGTRLTGRHISQLLFPFSYNEYLKIKSLEPTDESAASYMKTGGFPEYLKSGDAAQIIQLFDDIIIRDIVARFGVKDVSNLQRLAVYLLSNIGNKVTASKLKQTFSISATTTILSWFSHFEQCFLFSFLPLYSTSLKAQLINPRKIYTIDLGFVEQIAFSFSDNYGQKFENLVYLFLRRTGYQLFYYQDTRKNECDFVVMKGNAAIQLIQVCYELNSDNVDRELDGIISALQYFKLSSGLIVSFAQSDILRKDGFEIKVVNASSFLLSQI